jgi:hypothetical protein
MWRYEVYVSYIYDKKKKKKIEDYYVIPTPQDGHVKGTDGPLG